LGVEVEKDRFARIEVRVDEIKEDVTELKTEFRIHKDLIEEHVVGDQKIIKEIQPLLAAIPSIERMVGDFEYKKENRRRNKEKLKNAGVKLGISATLLSIMLGILKLLTF
jgi:hypothetical protein